MSDSVSQADIAACLRTLQALAEDGSGFAALPEDQRLALLTAAGRLVRPNRLDEKQRQKASRRQKARALDQENRQARAATGIRKAREAAVFTAPAQLLLTQDDQPKIKLNSPRNCYVCKAEFVDLHFFYDTLCPACAAFNYQKRFPVGDLAGQVVLITGSRLKIGYQATLMLLRAGATVIATTRFPVDSALRYSREADFAAWKDRLQIFGLDLRHTPSVEIFCSYIEQTYPRLDHLINNAAQTVRRPPGFWAHLMDNELKPVGDLNAEVRGLLRAHYECVDKLAGFSDADSADKALPVDWEGRAPGLGLRASAALSQVPYTHDHTVDTEAVFPRGQLDVDLQQVDLRTTNSWRLKLGEIQTSEMIEIQLVNAIAPFVLCNRLSSLMKRDYTGKKHIVNVSAMEGKFHRFKKADRHPHTNMAKAALNMLTHTSASELAKHGIFMNAVDTGWVTDEDPAVLSAFKQEVHDFQPPLDIVDGAARVVDPIFDGQATGQHWCGQFLKDYRPIDW